MTESTVDAASSFVARYRAGTSTKFAIRGWLVAVVLAAVLSAIFIPLVITTGNVVPGIIGGIFILIVVIWAASSAFRAPLRWGADDRLAIAISDAGVTVPTVGLLEWDRIVGFKLSGAGYLSGNLFLRVLQTLNGTRTHQEITVFTRGNMTSVARKLDAAGRQHVRPGLEKGTVGYATAWAQGLSDPSFAQVAAAVETAATQRALPVAS